MDWLTGPLPPDVMALIVIVAGSAGAFARKWFNRHEETNASVTWLGVLLTGPALLGSGLVSVTTPVMTAAAALIAGAGASDLVASLVGRTAQVTNAMRSKGGPS